jgi:TPR repeat protein
LGLARYYYFGLGGKRDLRLAYEHLSKADPEDNPEAALMMAELLYLGVAGVNPDISRAKQLLLSAADAGYPYAMLRLARIAKGDGRYMAFALLMLEGLLNALKLSWKNDKDARLLGMGGRHGRLVLEGVVARQSDPESEADNLQS